MCNIAVMVSLSIQEYCREVLGLGSGSKVVWCLLKKVTFREEFKVR